MGLDTYAARDGKLLSEDLFVVVPPVLVGGMLSGNGNGPSFRGKVYAPFLHNAIGMDLYQEEIPTDKVKRAADLLDKWLLENPNLDFSDITREEIQALAKWFHVTADNGGVVVGWW